MSNLEKYLELKRRDERLNREYEKYEWEVQQILKELLEKHGCKDLHEARKLLKQLEREEAELGTRFKKAYDAYMEEYNAE